MPEIGYFLKNIKKMLEKVCKKFLKNLVVKKKGLTFATAFRFKSGVDFFKWFFDLLVIIIERKV